MNFVVCELYLNDKTRTYEYTVPSRVKTCTAFCSQPASCAVCLQVHTAQHWGILYRDQADCYKHLPSLSPLLQHSSLSSGDTHQQACLLAMFWARAWCCYALSLHCAHMWLARRWGFSFTGWCSPASSLDSQAFPHGFGKTTWVKSSFSHIAAALRSIA
jgi:hypothetical protein